jgi:hypothetical protein
MQISIDAILGSARSINNQKQIDEDSLSGKKKSEIKRDSVSIAGRIDSRLDSLETEFKDIQSSITKNQIILNGIELLREDSRTGGLNSASILSETLFQGRPVLKEVFGENPAEGAMIENELLSAESIENETSRLRKLQVELDNIAASNLTAAGRNDKISDTLSNIEAFSNSGGPGQAERISNVRPDSVMRLIK